MSCPYWEIPLCHRALPVQGHLFLLPLLPARTTISFILLPLLKRRPHLCPFHPNFYFNEGPHILRLP